MDGLVTVMQVARCMCIAAWATACPDGRDTPCRGRPRAGGRRRSGGLSSRSPAGHPVDTHLSPCPATATRSDTRSVTPAPESNAHMTQQNFRDVGCNQQVLQRTTVQGPRPRSVSVRHLLSPCAIASSMVWDTLIVCASAVLRRTHRPIQAEDQT